MRKTELSVVRFVKKSDPDVFAPTREITPKLDGWKSVRFHQLLLSPCRLVLLNDSGAVYGVLLEDTNIAR